MTTTRAFSASKYGQQLFNVAGSRKLRVATFGESHGQQSYLGMAIQEACWRLYNADIIFDTRSVFVGTGDAATTLVAAASRGQVFATGSTTTNHLVNTQIPQAQLDPNRGDIAFIASGYNDQNSPDLATITGRVISAANSLFAMGYKYVVICGIGPRATVGSVAWQGYNQIMRNYVSATQGAFFMDNTAALGDFQNAAANPQFRDLATNAAGTYNSMTADGTHIAMRGVRALAPLVAAIFKQICSIRTPRQIFNAGDYNSSTGRYTNLLGDAGNMMGTSGILQGSANPGVAGTSSTSRILMTVNGTGFSATPTLITGASGERKQHIVLANTAGAAGASLQLVLQNFSASPNNGVATRMMDTEALISLTGVTGLSEVQLRQPGSTDYYSIATGTTSPSQQRPDNTTEDIFAYTLYPVPIPASANPSWTMMFYFGNGALISGAIDISRWSAALVAE